MTFLWPLLLAGVITVFLAVMQANLTSQRNALLRRKEYCASSNFLENIEWRSQRNGQVLFDISGKCNLVASVVGRIIDHHFNCGPTGNYVNRNYGSLEGAKYQLHVSKPTGTPFAKDFEKVLQNLNTVQDQIASTPVRSNLIARVGTMDTVRFARSVFEKRVRQRKRSKTDLTQPHRRSNWNPPTAIVQTVKLTVIMIVSLIDISC
jgi:hypothetical protein